MDPHRRPFFPDSFCSPTSMRDLCVFPENLKPSESVKKAQTGDLTLWLGRARKRRL